MSVLGDKKAIVGRITIPSKKRTLSGIFRQVNFTLPMVECLSCAIDFASKDIVQRSKRTSRKCGIVSAIPEAQQYLNAGLLDNDNLNESISRLEDIWSQIGSKQINELVRQKSICKEFGPVQGYDGKEMTCTTMLLSHKIDDDE